MEVHTGPIFKYYGVERIGVFDNLMVRFTQTIDLNDPEECLPKFKFFCDKKVKIQRATEVFERNCPNCTSKRERKQLIHNFLKVFNWRKEIELSYRRHLDIIGIFSLSDSPFNAHLWERYADGGFCIEFDCDSEFFSPRSNDAPGTGELYRVTYSNTPIEFNAKQFFQNGHKEYMQLKVFYQKTEKWHEEKEIRIIRLRSLADETSNDGRVSLFKIPNEAFKSVYFAVNAKEEFIEEATVKIKQTLPNISIFKMSDIKSQTMISI